MKKILLPAGLVVAGLIAFTTYSGGLKMPAALASLFGSDAGPMKREFPRGGPDANAEPEAPADAAPGEGALGEATPVDGAVPAPTPAAPGTPVSFAQENVNVRIARAMELSKSIVTTDPSQTAPAAPAVALQGLYSTVWAGQYLGPDAGTLSIAVQADGSVQGQGVSSLTGITFTLNGKMQSNGQLELNQSAATLSSSGAVFTGALSKSGRGTGTWTVPSYNVAGSWDLSPVLAQ